MTHRLSRFRRLLDRAAGRTIAVGGLAVIVSILAILVFLVLEVLPLFQAPTAAGQARVAWPDAAPLLLGLDEHHEIAYGVTHGGIRFLDAHTGQVLDVATPPALAGRRITAAARAGAKSSRYLVGTADGFVIPIKVAIATEFSASGARSKRPTISADQPRRVADRPITALSYTVGDDGATAVAQTGDGGLTLLHAPASDALADAEVRRLPSPPGRVTALALDAPLLDLYLGTSDGWLHHVSLRGPEPPTLIASYPAAPGDAVTGLGFLIGQRTLVLMTRAGAVTTWSIVRDPERADGRILRQTHGLPRHPAPVTAFSPSQRDRTFVTGDAQGHIHVQHATSEQTLLRLPGSGSPVEALALAPKGDGILAYDAAGQATLYSLHNPHPEITVGTLFGGVWYEGYAGPAEVWQSSSGSDDFEPKFGLTPLAFGTLKGTVYALLLAIPIAVLAAVFTSQFMHPDLRATIKPTIELLAALPTVVLGFLAGLWLAPLVERIVPALAGMAVVLPLLVVTVSVLWRAVPAAVSRRLRPGTEALLLIPVLVAGAAVCLAANGPIEQALFGGDYKGWLADRFGLQYDQRNALVVGLVMGFAIIPIIFSISEEALTNVPRHLIAGSLALGATPWQTVTRLVLLAASPGLFSAVMIGFGRAVGETMIVLMATGNTPITDWSWTNGFRTLSANIAVEIPEAPHEGTLYRVLFLSALLLFVVTFVINTAAELVRHRLRKKYASL